MKRISLYLGYALIICSFLFCTACQNNTPEKTITKFATHWYQGDLEKTKKYVAPNSQMIVDLLSQNRPTDHSNNMKKSDVKVTFLESNIMNDTIMTYQCRIQVGERSFEKTFLLDKIEKKWCINLTN